MADPSLLEKLAEYEKVSGAPEAGASHYLKRGALQGISALADAVPNLYNLGKIQVGLYGAGLAKVLGKEPVDFMPKVDEASPIANFLLREKGLDKPVTPSSSIGGPIGAAVLEGTGAGVGQGPMGLVGGGLKSVATQLLKQEAKGALVGGAAGGGSEVGAEATEGSPIGRIIGGLLGGVAVPSSFVRNGGLTIGAIRSAADTARDIKAQGIPMAAGKIEPAFSDYVNSQLRGAAAGTPSAADNLTEGLRLRGIIPNFNPSVAEMSNSPGLVDMQKKFALLSPKNLNAEVARTEGNKSAIQEFYRSKVPAVEAPGSIRSAVNQKLADYEKILEEQGQGVAGRLPIANQLGIGDVLSTAAQAEKTAAKPAITAAYQKAFDVSGDSTISGSGIVSKIEDILGEPLSQIKPSNAPQTALAIRRIFGDKNVEATGRSIPPDLMALQEGKANKGLTLNDLHDIRVALNQDVASASRASDPAASTRLFNLGKVMPEVDAAIAKLPGAGDYQAATAKYRNEYAPRFKEGANARVFKDTSLNEPKILPDRFVSEYFRPDSQGGGTRASQFSRLFGENPEAKDIAKIGILDIYRQKVVNPTTGAIDPSAHDSFMRDYGRTLQAYKASGVDAASEINSIGQEAAKVSRSMSELKSLSQSMKFDTVDDLVSNSLKNPKTMGNTLTRLDPEKRAIFNTMLLDKSFETGTAKGMREFLDTNQKTLRMTVPKEQLDAVNDIAKALEITERAPIRGNLAAGGADMLKNATGTSTATVFSQIRAVTGGRSSAEWAAINLAMPALNKMSQTSFANVMENALHSPESAVALRNYLLADSPEVANKWATQLLNGMKSGGKLVWSARGPIVSNFIGPERYPENLGRSGVAIQSSINEGK